MADQFGVQLEHLDDLSGKRLPGIRDDLESSLLHLNAARDDEAAAMPGQFGTVAARWADTHNFLRRVLEDNATNAGLAAEAIKQIALRYRQADGQA